jgi:hypothetical protein
MSLQSLLQIVAWCFLVVVYSAPASSLLAQTSPPISGTTIDDVLTHPQSQSFWIERKAGTTTMGDPRSYYNKVTNYSGLTFDIGNNKALANIGLNGEIKTLTIYRDSYRASCDPAKGFPGVWLAKDSSSFGSYSYSVEMDGQTNDLAKVDWDCRTGLLDNIFPLTELHDPKGRFTAKLITFAPISADGQTRLRGVIYGLQLHNTAQSAITGIIHLPKMFTGSQTDRGKASSWAQYDPFDFEIGLADRPDFTDHIAFNLKPQQTIWVPTILYMPGEPTIDQINARSSLAWLNDTWAFYRHLLGRVQTAGDPYIGEFYERQMMEVFLSIAMSGTDKLAGSNWGSYPATRQIWAKDCFYACLPFMSADPFLARKMILWFDEFGVRQKGQLVEGGINHSISLSVASVLLAGLYYQQTGDVDFFTQHPELKQSWLRLLSELVQTRVDPDVWLFPTRYISDGRLECDYHTGSNIAVWRALQGFSRILRDVYRDPTNAQLYSGIADNVHAAILAKTVIPGSFGPQFIEGTHRDGSPPLMYSDGEESDTTLMPFYGFCRYDEPTYLNFMHFCMTTQNKAYNAQTHAINWISSPGRPSTISTAPGYNKGIAFGSDTDSLFGDSGYFSEIRYITDADGTVPWWPYAGKKLVRSTPGKAGWFSGVFATLFQSRLFGISYDAPTHQLSFAPLPAIGDFSWQNLPMGDARFDVALTHTSAGPLATFTNHTNDVVTLAVTLPIATDVDTLYFNDDKQSAAAREQYLGARVLKASIAVKPAQTLRAEVKP